MNQRLQKQKKKQQQATKQISAKKNNAQSNTAPTKNLFKEPKLTLANKTPIERTRSLSRKRQSEAAEDASPMKSPKVVERTRPKLRQSSGTKYPSLAEKLKIARESTGAVDTGGTVCGASLGESPRRASLGSLSAK